MSGGMEPARLRHNVFAPQIATMIVVASDGDPAKAVVMLESIIVGVLDHFFRGNVRAASETLDTITVGAMERLG